ncbi:MAG TPA: hypothetical protein VFG04_02675 [Planctomycetaceae bacterium]|jgi:hypothetical protein|nr:hypothetical protein [Planctomycetaceae bacterium]
MPAFDRSRPRDRLVKPMVFTILAGVAVFVLLERGPNLAADRDKIPAPPAHSRPFDDVRSQRMITGAQQEPVFIDIDTGRWMTLPASLLAQENKGQSIEHWSFSEPLKHWIQHSGIDLGMQTDGNNVSVVGFDLRVGDQLTEPPRSEAEVAQKVSNVRLAGAEWITLRRSEVPVHVGQVGRGQPIVKAAIRYGTPFVTREGGLGTFNFHLTDLWGVNSIQFDYQLTRRPHVPQLTGQQVFAVYEPQILSSMATFLIADVSDHKLCLRTPGSSNQIEISADEVVVRESGHPELRAARLHTGTLGIDAPTGSVTVNGRGKSATLRRVGDHVQVEFKKRVAESDEIILWMPELEIHDRRLKWEPVKAELPRKPH